MELCLYERHMYKIMLSTWKAMHTWCNVATSKETKEENLRKRREHDRLRTQMETTEERFTQMTL